MVNSGIASQFSGVHFINLLHGRLLIIRVFVCIKYFLIKSHPKTLPLSLLKAQACTLWNGFQVPPEDAAAPAHRASCSRLTRARLRGSGSQMTGLLLGMGVGWGGSVKG